MRGVDHLHLHVHLFRRTCSQAPLHVQRRATYFQVQPTFRLDERRRLVRHAPDKGEMPPSDRTAGCLPVFVLQQTLVQLARRMTGEFGTEINGAWALDVCKMFLAVCD